LIVALSRLEFATAMKATERHQAGRVKIDLFPELALPVSFSSTLWNSNETRQIESLEL
jgi:hypothetical protein